MKSLRRKFDGKISEGQWSQLLWVFFFIGLTFTFFLFLSKILYGPNVFGWQDIIALFLDPGVFNGVGQHDLFRLIITLFGAFLFAAVLISIVGNIFNNVSDSYRKGETRYKFKNHILILGGSSFLFDILKGIETDEKKMYHNRQIVVMTTRQTDELRDEVAAFLNNKKFLKRITFYFDKRDNKENLKGAYADKADFIYVIGEDKEPDHDMINISCCNLLHSIVKNENTECYVIMNSQTTMQLYFPELRGLRNDKMELIYNTPPPQVAYNEIFLNINEVKAEFILSNTILKLINFSKDFTVNVVIFGMTSFGRALAITIARTFHFCNNNKTKITIIDSDLKSKKDDFDKRNELLFEKCNSEYVSESAINEEKTFLSEAEISWVFVDAAPSSDTVDKYLHKIRKHNNTFSFVCFDDVSKNIATTLNLRNRFPWLNTFANFGDFENVLSSRLAGLAIDSSHSVESFFSYIFNERQIKVREYYDCKENKISDLDWKDLYYGDRQLVTYKATASILKKRSNIIDGVFCCKGCAEFAQYMMGIGDEDRMKAKGLYYDESNRHYMDQIREYLKNDPFANHHPKSRDYILKLNDENSDENKEYINYINNLNKVFERIHGQYLHSLQQHNDECDIVDYFGYLLKSPYLDSDSFKKFLKNLSEYIKSHRLSERTTFAILQYCKPENKLYIDDNGEIIELTTCDIPNTIVNLSKEIIKEQANNDIDGTYSYLAMSTICDKYEDMKYWYEKVVNNNNQYCIPHSYYAQIGKEKVERLYHDTQSEIILDWLILEQIPEIRLNNFKTDFVSIVEKYISELTNLEKADLFYRLGVTNGLNSCFQGMWLQKAERVAKEEDSISILFLSFLQLTVYFASRDENLASSYCDQAIRLIKDKGDSIKLNSSIFDNLKVQNKNAKYYIYKIKEDFNQLKDNPLLKHNSDNTIESSSKTISNKTNYEWPDEDTDKILEFQSQERNILENDISEIQKMIKKWEEEFPNIQHPYSEVLSALLRKF